MGGSEVPDEARLAAESQRSGSVEAVLIVDAGLPDFLALASVFGGLLSLLGLLGLLGLGSLRIVHI